MLTNNAVVITVASVFPIWP